jgi:hypothetical protein
MMKLFAGLIVLASFAIGAAIVFSSGPKLVGGPVVPQKIASPADTFVVHDAAPPATPTPAPPAQPGGPSATPAPPSPDAALAAAVDRLRAAAAAAPATPAPASATPTPAGAATPAAPSPVPAPASPAPGTPVINAPAASVSAPQSLGDTLLAGPNPAPSILSGPPPPPTPVLPPKPVWTSVTTQGVRWRSIWGGAGPALVIDMGGGRTATVEVDPAFGALPPAAANDRVDYLKETILENFPPGSTRFRFLRDGSVALLR